MNRIAEEAKIALNAKASEEQMKFIENIEELLMDDDNVISLDEIQTCFSVLSKYILDDNKNLVQRSMTIIEALCESYKDSIAQAGEESKINDNSTTNLIFKSTFQCLNDPRPNIREQTVRTIQALIALSTFTLFCQNIADQALSFSTDGQIEVIQILKQHQEDMQDSEWNLIFHFLVQCYDDKNSTIKSNAQELCKNESFLTPLQDNFTKLNTQQKKLFQPMLDSKPPSSGFNKGFNPFDETNLDDADSKRGKFPSKKIPKNVVELNTSAFSRKKRQSGLKDSDGLFLLTDFSTFTPFMRRLSLDIKDVFDDELSDMLLSQQSYIRVSAVNKLREIFDGAMKNFENSVDILIRWCVIQFLGWQLNISQASLSLLSDMFDRCTGADNFSLTSKEVHILIPIVLWCTTTESDAFKYLLQQIKTLSKEKDYADSLIMSLSLDHLSVITCIFDELKQMKSVDSIKGQLQELNMESTKTMIRYECKKLLQKLTPLSPRRMQSLSEPVSRLQLYITQIKTNPEGIEDCHEIFGYLLDLFDKKLKNGRDIRYLLYCTHAFLSEPILILQINMNDFTTLVTSICEFSIECPLEFNDAIMSLGYVIASVHTNISIFDALINFITKHYSTQTRRGFAFQMFTIGIQMMAINQNSNELMQLKQFAKSVIGQYSAKDDMRAVLCRNLLSEILLIDGQKKNDIEMVKKFEESNVVRPRPVQNNNNSMNISEQEQNSIIQQNASLLAANSNEDLFDFLRILKRLSRQESRFEAIRELIAFDDRFPGEKIVDTIVRLSPLLGKHIESIRNRSNSSNNSRPSSRTSNRGDDDMNRSFGYNGSGSRNNSRPSSRSSQRQSSVGYENRTKTSTGATRQNKKPTARMTNAWSKYQNNY